MANTPTKPPITPKDDYRPWKPGEIRRLPDPNASAASQIWGHLPTAARPEIPQRPTEKGKQTR
jgi:hypothetical protein